MKKAQALTPANGSGARALRLCSWLAVVCFGSLSTVPAVEVLFPNSIVSNDLEFIRADDPKDAFEVTLQGRGEKEMPDKRSDELMMKRAYEFQLSFADGAKVEVDADEDFTDQAAAEIYVRHVGDSLAKLPLYLRTRLSHVVLHLGDEVAFSEDKGHFFVLYSANMDKRLGTHDLDETVFHETIHATLDAERAASPHWLAAQKADPGFITAYAAKLPKGEDLAESALFAYTMLRHPGRLPEAVETSAKEIMPARLVYLRALFVELEAEKKDRKAK